MVFLTPEMVFLGVFDRENCVLRYFLWDVTNNFFTNKIAKNPHFTNKNPHFTNKIAEKNPHFTNKKQATWAHFGLGKAFFRGRLFAFLSRVGKVSRKGGGRFGCVFRGFLIGKWSFLRRFWAPEPIFDLEMVFFFIGNGVFLIKKWGFFDSKEKKK
jgi:hypothetical protein